MTLSQIYPSLSKETRYISKGADISNIYGADTITKSNLKFIIETQLSKF